MKLNRVETALMHNPLRTALQRYYEARLLERLGGDVAGLRVLEIGCGRGVGAEVALERLGARRVYAFDVDMSFVREARRRSLTVVHSSALALLVCARARIRSITRNPARSDGRIR